MEKAAMKEAIIDFQKKLNEPPAPEEIRELTEGVYYIPISIIDEKLNDIFMGFWEWRLQRESIHAKGIFVVGQLSVKHPVTDEWIVRSGTAAMAFRKGMEMDFPSLESEARKNAAKKFGKTFGSDLNRKLDDHPRTIQIREGKEADDDEDEDVDPNEDRSISRLKKQMNKCTSIEDLAKYKEDAKELGLVSFYMDKAKKFTS